jgi:hypothetical protein
MELAGTLAFAALMVAHVTAYFAVRLFYAGDGERQHDEIDALPSAPGQTSEA